MTNKVLVGSFGMKNKNAIFLILKHFYYENPEEFQEQNA